MTRISTRDLYVLDESCQIIKRAYGDDLSGVYLVGSAQEGKESPRDIDVRWILDDPDFDRLFKGDDGWFVGLWEMMCLTTAEYLRSRTGLPVDFQIQRRSVANEKHAKPRNPLGSGRRPYAGHGDGTDWTGRFLAAEPSK